MSVFSIFRHNGDSTDNETLPYLCKILAACCACKSSWATVGRCDIHIVLHIFVNIIFNIGFHEFHGFSLVSRLSCLSLTTKNPFYPLNPM